MSEEEDRQTLSIQLAKSVINMANNRLQEGMNPIDIAAGMRHAAANFSAFVVANSTIPKMWTRRSLPRNFCKSSFTISSGINSRPITDRAGALINQVKNEN